MKDKYIHSTGSWILSYVDMSKKQKINYLERTIKKHEQIRINNGYVIPNYEITPKINRLKYKLKILIEENRDISFNVP